MIVGFCSTAMNRRWQLERTLASNLRLLRGSGSFLALADYHSADSLESFVLGFAEDVRSGTLLYFRTEEPAHFHAGKAKNLAHRLAKVRRPDVLFNLDADNYLSFETLEIVNAAFVRGESVCLHGWTGADSDGSFGRIALRTADWEAVGGYDEALLPATWEDLDLLVRCRAAGFQYRHEPRGVPRPVPNRIGDRLAHIDPVFISSERDPAHQYFALYKRNLVISMGRPPRLRVEDQQRFSGVLNFTEPRTI
jgi:hypothetical protein